MGSQHGYWKYSQRDDGTDPGTEQLFFKPIAQKSAMVFRSITKVEGYLEVPVTTVLENEHGALILKQVGEPMPLVKARLHNGLDLTVKEVKSVLSAHDVVLPGAPSKSDCYAKLMELHAENDLQMQEFLQKSKVKLNQGDEEEEDRVSEYEELLGMIEEDDINRNDPDVKQERGKTQKEKASKAKGT